MQSYHVVITGQREAEFREVAFDPALQSDEVLIQTEWSFISTGTELANYTGAEPDVFTPGAWCAYPWNSGYANVGIVRDVGGAVRGFKPGDRVFSHGSHASHVKMRTNRLLVKVPDDLDPCLAVASRMAGVSVSAVVMADPRMHPWVAVFGLGFVGNVAAQAFRILGGRVIGIDPVAKRRALAEACGIRWTTGGGGADETQAVLREITGGDMADITVEATGLTPVIPQALRATANVGQVVLLGSPRVPYMADLTQVFKDIHLRYLTVRGALEWCPPTYPVTSAQNGRTFAMPSLLGKQTMIFDWLREGALKLDALVTHRLPPTAARDAYEGLLNQPGVYFGVALDWRDVGS